MTGTLTPKIEVLDDEENIINFNLDDEASRNNSLDEDTDVAETVNYIQLFNLYPLIVSKTSNEVRKPFGNVNQFLYVNGNAFEGKTINDLLHGRGEFYWADTGTRYIGDFKENRITGRGKITWLNQSEYIGDVVDGIRHGIGTYTDTNGLQYIGQWKNGKKHGKGRLNYTTDGSVYYDGEWHCGLRHGYGVYRYPNGATYEGQWKDGKRNGEGTMHWSDRDEIYTGSWVDGKQHGLGCHAWHILRVRTSQYCLPNVYDDNLKHGTGTLILKDGRIFERTFYEDRFIDTSSDSIPQSVDQPSLERLDTRVPLVTEYMTDPTEEDNFKDTSDSNLLESYLKPHISPLDYNTSEFQKIQNVITTYLAPLRSIYRFYGKLGMTQLPDNTIILRYVQFCQFLKDCKLHQHTSLAALDRIIAISFGSEDSDETSVQNPEKLISFGSFVNIVVILACNLYTQEEFIWLKRAIRANQVMLYYLEKSKDILSYLQPFHQAYRFFVRIKRRFQKAVLPPPYTITMRTFLFILKDFNLFDRKLTASDVVEALCKSNPVSGTIDEYNADTELTFFDFFEAVIHCASVSFLKKDEPYEEKMKLSVIDLSAKQSRRLSRRPSTSRQSKTNYNKKLKEKKSKMKRNIDVRKSSISPEFQSEKPEKQNGSPEEIYSQEEQLQQNNSELGKTDVTIQSETERWDFYIKSFVEKFLTSVEKLQIQYNRVYSTDQLNVSPTQLLIRS
ncbi:unnamed protein product [Heterobilharzia americana]|nr:unnamed protein product [Heterobilharzia americana]